MQCTGLRDREGKLIYEGDITSLFVAGEKRRFTVSLKTVKRKLVHPGFPDTTSNVMITGVAFEWDGHQLFPCASDGVPDNEKMKIIGNIYENQELLEVPNDQN